MIDKLIFNVNCPNYTVDLEDCLDNFEDFIDCGLYFIEDKLSSDFEDEKDDLLCYLIIKGTPPMKSFLRPHSYTKFLENALKYYISNEIYEKAPRVQKLLDIIKNNSYARERIKD